MADVEDWPPVPCDHALPDTTTTESDLLSHALQIWAHTILWKRHVYESSRFANVTFLGVTSCPLHRNEEVVSYIRDSMKMVQHAVVLQIVAEQEHDEPKEQEEDDDIIDLQADEYTTPIHNDIVIETHVLDEFSVSLGTPSATELRDMILAARSLPAVDDAHYRGYNLQSLSFRIVVSMKHTKEIETGEWRNVDDEENGGRIVRPLYSKNGTRFTHRRLPKSHKSINITY